MTITLSNRNTLYNSFGESLYCRAEQMADFSFFVPGGEREYGSVSATFSILLPPAGHGDHFETITQCENGLKIVVIRVRKVTI